MICPLKVINATVPTELIKPSEIIDCDEIKCAWWFGAQNCCSITAIANQLELAKHGNFGG